MKEIKFYNSVWSGLAAFLPAFFLLFAIRNEIPDIFSFNFEPKALTPVLLFSVVFFSFGAILGINILLDRRPKIFINNTGIRESSFSSGEIKWEDIRRAVPKRLAYFINYLTLEVDTEAPQRMFFGRIIKPKKSFRINTLLLNTFNLKIDVHKVAELINEMVVANPEERANLLDQFQK